MFTCKGHISNQEQFVMTYRTVWKRDLQTMLFFSQEHLINTQYENAIKIFMSHPSLHLLGSFFRFLLASILILILSCSLKSLWQSSLYLQGAGVKLNSCFILQLENLEAEGWILASESNSSILFVSLLPNLSVPSSVTLLSLRWHVSHLPSLFLFLSYQTLRSSPAIHLLLCLVRRSDVGYHSNDNSFLLWLLGWDELWPGASRLSVYPLLLLWV